MGKFRDYNPALKYGNLIYPEDLASPGGMPPYVNEMWYVDGVSGGDGGQGNAIDHSFATIQKSLDVCASYDYILVLPSTYREEVNTPQCGGARGVTLAGHYNGLRSENRTGIYPDTASDHAIDVRAQGWRITGFRIILATGTGAGVRLQYVTASETTGTNNSPYTTVDSCLFYANVYGIYSDGAPHGVHILNNEFLSNSTTAIYNASTGVKGMSQWIVRGNSFIGNGNGLYFMGTCDNNIVSDNFFNDSAATKVCYFDSASSTNNEVVRNSFMGTYDISSGYKAGGANNVWAGNYGVSGVTTGVPA